MWTCQRLLTQCIILFLLEKLSIIGLETTVLKWFKNYLSDRTQCVLLENIKSELLSITAGVPQGSILGPVLFTLYINYILSSITDVKFHLYADDTIMYWSLDAFSCRKASAFINLQQAPVYLKLVLHSSKTKCMLFSKARNCDYDNLLMNIKCC